MVFRPLELMPLRLLVVDWWLPVLPCFVVVYVHVFALLGIAIALLSLLDFLLRLVTLHRNAIFGARNYRWFLGTLSYLKATRGEFLRHTGTSNIIYYN